MGVRTNFLRRVELIENTWIPLSDGCRLAARIWLPEDALGNPVPALLEYIPYRKDDSTAEGDSRRHAYLAGHGYGSVRVDMRGSGDSDGILEDEYLPLEQDDACEVIAWLAEQQWCTGSVGMFGISWGGFNALQVAARRPRALKAIISHCSTDDRYADDIHYKGGCVLACDMLGWASTLLAMNVRPPDPKVVGEQWREMWFDRLERAAPFIETWLAHQRRDAYWKQGSVCEDFSAIDCAVYMVGGWADPYTNAVLRTLGGYRGPRKALIGSWGHQYPEDGSPGPAIGFNQESIRWWDHWLKGEDNGIMAEPVLRVWMQEPFEPHTSYEARAGRWVAEEEWPSPAIEMRSYELGAGVLLGSSGCGLDAGHWMPGKTSQSNVAANRPSGDFPPDQRAEDGLSLTFDLAPLDERIELLGFPEVELELAVDRPTALVAVRLCDVAPDGTTTLVTRGLLNLTHRKSHEDPSVLVPGRRYTVHVRLDAIAQAVGAGHHLRVAVSPTYWPWAWPSPEPVTLTLVAGELCLPVRPPRAGDAELAPFDEPEWAPPLELEVLSLAPAEYVVSRDYANGVYELVRRPRYGPGAVRFPDGLEYEQDAKDVFRIVEGDPLSASCRCEYGITISRGDWRTRVESFSTMSADADTFYVTSAVNAYEGSTRVFAKTWSASIPRDLL
jgi:putative CocE/NonD family hydrolase